MASNTLIPSSFRFGGGGHLPLYLPYTLTFHPCNPRGIQTRPSNTCLFGSIHLETVLTVTPPNRTHFVPLSLLPLASSFESAGLPRTERIDAMSRRARADTELGSFDDVETGWRRVENDPFGRDDLPSCDQGRGRASRAALRSARLSSKTRADSWGTARREAEDWGSSARRATISGRGRDSSEGTAECRGAGRTGTLGASLDELRKTERRTVKFC